ncbi:GNAT family N-acetyltransferase, partial [bacterium]|nr:GNAT family N-acetyltransferase [bacterium]
MNKNLFLQSENIVLQAMEIGNLKELSKKITKWVNDGVVTYFMFTGQIPKNSKQVFVDFKKMLDSNDNIIFLIVDKNTKKSIGYAGLHEINQSSRKAEFRILIGEKDFWGKGLGTEITELLTFYGFDRLNLNRV